MASTLTKNYSPRVKYDSNYPIGHPNNQQYVDMLANLGMTRITSSAQPYHKKHNGVKNKGKVGKVVTVTIDDLKEIIIKSNGKSPNGADIYFGPSGILLNPTKAQEYGMITDDDRSRFPSWDRIDSSKGYSKENIQLTTKSYNLGKSTNDVVSSNLLTERVTIRWKGAEAELYNPTSSFVANTLKELAN